MVYFRSSIIYLITCQFMVLGFSPTSISAEATIRQKAFYISENNCEKLSDDSTAAPILYEASDVILVGKANEKSETYGPKNAQYSMKVTPHCLMRGDTSENEVVVRNLGKTKCGESNVDIGGNYLFFLRRTSDPKVYEALNVGAKRVFDETLWSDILTFFCGLKRVTKCKAGNCSAACNYDTPSSKDCILPSPTIGQTFNILYPDGFPTTTQTTQRRKDVTEESTTVASDIKKNKDGETTGDVTPKVEGVKGTTGQAGLSTNIFFITLNVFIVLLLCL